MEQKTNLSGIKCICIMQLVHTPSNTSLQTCVIILQNSKKQYVRECTC